MRLAVPIATVVLAAVLAGCGGDSGGGSGATTSARPPTADGSTAPAGASTTACAARSHGVSGLRVSGVSCAAGHRTVTAWSRAEGCEPAAGAGRSGCDAGPYRCLSVMTARGLDVSCARPGESVSFRVKR